MVDQFNLMGAAGAGVVEQEEVDYDRLSIEFLENTAKLLESLVRYPAGNKIIVNANERWKRSIQQVLLLHNSLMVTLLGNTLYFEELKIESRNNAVQHFTDRMFQRRIRKIIFWRGINDVDLEHFANLMGMKAEAVLEQGGPAHILDKVQVKGIQVIENQYLRANEMAAMAKSHLEKALLEAGLDSGEIIALLSGKGRLPRILSDEILLLAEAMKDPTFLSQLLVKVAQDGNESVPPSAQELIRICRRVQYILVMSAGFDGRASSRMLSRAVQALDEPLRDSLLEIQIQLESLDPEIFVFTADDYARHLLRMGGVDQLVTLPTYILRPRQIAAVTQSYQGMLASSPGWEHGAEEASRSAKERCNALGAMPILSLEEPAPPDEEAHAARPNLEQTQHDVKARTASFMQDLTAGYAYTLLYLYRATVDENHARDLSERLLVLVEVRLELRRYSETLDLLQFMCDPSLDDAKRQVLKERLEKLVMRHEGLLKYLVDQLLAGSPSANNTFDAMAGLFGIEVWNKLFSLLLEHTGQGPSDMLRQLIARHEAQLYPVLESYLGDDDKVTRLQAVEALTMFQSEKMRSMVNQGLDDADPDVRFVTTLALGHGATDTGKRRLMQMAQVPSRRVKQRDRCAAVTSLGRLRYEPAIHTLGELAGAHPWVFRNRGYTLLACAALALRRIDTPQSLQTLAGHLLDIEMSKLDLLLRWLADRFQVLVRGVRWIIQTTIGTIYWVCVMPFRLLYQALDTASQWLAGKLRRKPRQKRETDQ